MSTHSGAPNDPDESQPSERRACVNASSKVTLATKLASSRRAIAKSWQVMTIPVISTLSAMILLVSGQVSSGHPSRFGLMTSSGMRSTTGLLADLLAHESASRVALRQDGTLSIDARIDTPDATGDETSAWVAATRLNAMSDTAVAGGRKRSGQAPEPMELPLGQPLVQAGMALSRTDHVNIVPPFVILSRGSESIMLSLESGSRVVPEHRLPSWVSQQRPNGRVVADFGWRGTVEVRATSVNVRRRTLDWHLPGTAI